VGTFKDIRNKNCELCKLHRTADVVCQIGWGKVDADVMVVTKMANSKEWQNDLELDLQEVGIDPRRVFYTQAIKCRTSIRMPEPRRQDNARRTSTWRSSVSSPSSFSPSATKLYWLLWTFRDYKVSGACLRPPHRCQGHSRLLLRPPSSGTPAKDPVTLPTYDSSVTWCLVEPQEFPSPTTPIIDTREKLDASSSGVLAMTEELNWDVETVSDYYKDDARIVSLSATCILSTESGPKRFVFALPLYPPRVTLEEKWRAVLKYLKPELEAIPKVTAWNGSYDTKWLRWLGINIRFTFDPMLAVHLLNENIQKGLKPTAQGSTRCGAVGYRHEQPSNQEAQ
jgi:hypothetical protein